MFAFHPSLASATLLGKSDYGLYSTGGYIPSIPGRWASSKDISRCRKRRTRGWIGFEFEFCWCLMFKLQPQSATVASRVSELELTWIKILFTSQDKIGRFLHCCGPSPSLTQFALSCWAALPHPHCVNAIEASTAVDAVDASPPPQPLLLPLPWPIRHRWCSTHSGWAATPSPWWHSHQQCLRSLLLSSMRPGASLHSLLSMWAYPASIVVDVINTTHATCPPPLSTQWRCVHVSS